jgi:hypothetical protein
MAATKRTSATKKTATTKRPAAAKKTQDEDVIARLADKGEDSLRWLVAIPHRMVNDVRGGVDARLHELAGKLRAMDPLDGRISELERRLGALEKPARRATRTSPTRAKATGTRRAGTAAAAAPERDRGAGAEATASSAERVDVPTGGGLEQTR